MPYENAYPSRNLSHLFGNRADGKAGRALVQSVGLSEFEAIGDGVTPDDVPIYNWLNSGATNLYLPAGTYAMADGWTYGYIPSTVRRIYGPGTLKYVGVNDFIPTLWVDADGIGGTPVTYNLEIDGITFYSKRSDYNAQIPFMMFATIGTLENVMLRRVHFAQSGRMAVYQSNVAKNCGVEDCLIENFGDSAIQFAGDANQGMFIRRNRIVGDNTQLIHTVIARGQVFIEDNTVIGNSNAGFGICVENAKPGTRIVGNKVLDGQWDKIEIINGNGFLIANNVIAQPNVPSVEIGIGVVHDSGLDDGNDFIKDGLVTGNVINDSYFFAIATDSVHNEPAKMDNIALVGNIINRPNQSGNANAGAIALIRSRHVAVMSNSLNDDTGKMLYGVVEVVGTTDSNNIGPNDMRGVVTGKTLKLGQHTILKEQGANLISTTTTTGGSTIVFTDIPDVYAELRLVIVGASSDTATRQLLIRLSHDNGLNYDSTAGNYLGAKLTGTTWSAITAASIIESATVTAAQSFDVDLGIRNYTQGHAEYKGRVLSNTAEYQVFGTYKGSTSAVNALQLLWDASGTFDAITASLYGIM